VFEGFGQCFGIADGEMQNCLICTFI